MPILLEHIEGDGHIARVYDGEPAAMAPYSATFIMERVGPRTCWIKALSGKLTRRTLRELVQLLVEHGVHTVLALRADGHALPGVTHVDEAGVHHIDVVALSHRFARPGASDWVELQP